MDYPKALFDRIRSFFAIPVRCKYFIIISAAVVVLAAVPFTLRALQERSSYLPVYTLSYPQTPPPDFIGFTQADRAHESLERAIEGSDRTVKLTILREIPQGEYANIPGMFASYRDVPKDKDGNRPSRIEGYPYAVLSAIFLDNGTLSDTLFEAVITYDYDKDIKTNEKIVIPYNGSYQYQEEGHPIYQPGEQYVMMLEKLWNPEGPLYRTWAIFDVEETDNEEYLFKCYEAFDEIPSLPMAASERTHITSTEENPAKYSQKFKLEDFITIVEQKRIEIKSKVPFKSEPAGTQ